MELETILALIKVFISLLFLAILGFEDLKTRELDSKIVYLYLSLSSILYALTLITIVNIVEYLVYTALTLLVTPGVFYILYKYGIIGDGDVYVSLALGLSLHHPTVYGATLVRYGIIPPALVAVLYASLIALLWSVLQGLFNTLHYRSLLKQLPFKYRAIILFLARPVKAGEFYEDPKYRHYYPLQIFKYTEQGIREEYNLLRLDDTTRQHVVELIEKGVIPRNYILWITPGLPYVFYMLIGLLILLVIGDKPLYYLLIKLLTYK
jgi:preflagellin peptidase FlaK